MADLPRAATRQQGLIEQMAHRRERHTEWPTVVLAVVIYGGWLALTWYHASLPVWLVVALGAWLVAWHSSLQHEVLHGHPTPSRRLNRWIGMVPLSLWLPFDTYRITHLIHHRDERLTDPLDDPESYYWTADQWAALNPLARIVVHAQTTLLGRIVLGPFWNVGRFLASEAAEIRAGNPTARRIWGEHLIWVAGVLVWLVAVCHMNPLFYLAAFVYPGTALLLVRSFAEHRAAEGVLERTAIVEGSWILGPLFLFNNLHAAHHDNPNLPWYRTPAWYRANRARIVADNGSLVYRTYFDVARRYLLRPHHRPPHPFFGGLAAPVAAESQAPEAVTA